ncbi:TetR/AcrR family transcriptional regulator [Pseudolysinimonas sp.]|uniref:TetR/AcrR family transcriptional regulator n=1 Tax=Pseudolysinimonas sp. TaxID=2680009 RepID=UPI003783128B
MDESGLDELLDAASHLVTEDGFDAVSIPRIALQAAMSEDQVLAHFGSLEDLLVSMLNREFMALWRDILDDIERDPRGGLLSHIYRYTISGVYERPLVRALYLADRDGLNTIMRSTHGFAYVPEFGMRTSFIEQMKEAGMVRPHVDAANLSAVLSAVSAGAALTAPHSQLDLVNEGLFDLLSASVDADVDDTSPGKVTFVEYAMSLTTPDGRG